MDDNPGLESNHWFSSSFWRREGKVSQVMLLIKVEEVRDVTVNSREKRALFGIKVQLRGCCN